MNGPRWTERVAVAGAAAVFLYLVFFRGATFIFPFPSGSNGVFFDEAHRVLAGEVMYRDFFEFVGPGTAHLNALVLLLCGPRIAALGALGVALGALAALLVHEHSCARLPPRWRLLPPAAFVVLVYAPYTFGDHKWPALCLCLLALALMRPLPVPPARAAGAGALLGAAALFTQDLAAGLGVGALAGLLWSRPRGRSVAAFLAAAAALPLLVMGLFAWKAGLDVVVYDTLVFPLTRYGELNRFRLQAFVAARTAPRDLAQLVLAGAGLAAALVALRRAAQGEERLVALAGLGMFAAGAHRGLFPGGLAVQTAVLLPLGIAALRSGRTAEPRAGALARGALLAVIVAGLVHGAVGFVAWRQWLQPLELERHRAGAVWTPRAMPELRWIEERVAAGQPTFLLPARGGHYFLTQTRDVTPYPYLIEGQHTPEQARRALAAIESARPAAGLWDQRPWPRGDPDSGGPLASLWDGLRHAYAVEPLPSGVRLLAREGP